MRPKYINPFTDYGFKKLFGEEASKNLLTAFLNDILPIKDKIVKIDFKKNEFQGDTAVSRKAVYDIFCEDEKGQRFIVEMQNAKQLYFKDRTVFYSTFPIREQAPKGVWNFKLEAVYCVALLGFNLKEESKLDIEEKIENKEYLNIVQLKDQNNKVFYNKLTFVFVELPKFKKTEKELTNHLDKWLYFLKNLDSFEAIPEILSESIFKESFNAAAVANFTEEEYQIYEFSLMNMRDNINVINTAREEGLEEGKELGKKLEKELGREIGRQEEKEQNRVNEVELVLKLLIKKFKVLDEALEEKIKGASSETLNSIIEEILDIESLQDVKQKL